MVQVVALLTSAARCC